MRANSAPQVHTGAPRTLNGTGALRIKVERTAVLRSARLERAIGVIYRPQTERESHCFRARVADQFDAVIQIDETRALEPLERTARWERGEAPETHPFAV